MNFAVGNNFSDGAFEYRVVAGKNCEGDMIIECRLPGSGWHRPKISHTLILVNFKFQVEENNYGANGKKKRGRGGWYLLEKIRRACLNGWEVEAEEIARQRAELKKRDEYAAAQMGLPI